MWVLAFLIGKAEEGSFHAEGEYHQYQCYIGVEVCHNAIATAGNGDDVSVEWYQQVVKEPAYYAAKAVYRGVLSERFH